MSRSCPDNWMQISRQLTLEIGARFQSNTSIGNGKSNGHVIKIQDGSLAEVCTFWVFFSIAVLFIKFGRDNR